MLKYFNYLLCKFSIGLLLDFVCYMMSLYSVRALYLSAQQGAGEVGPSLIIHKTNV